MATATGIKRIETGVAADYWSKWGMTHALKELVANAKDSMGKVTLTFMPPTDGKVGTLIIADDGPGFDKRCLMLGAGEQKGYGQIGQFKEGMKGAMLVCARNGRMVDLTTTGFSVPKVGIEPTQLGSDGFVLYVDEAKRTKRGTTVNVACTEDEVRKLLAHFTRLQISGLEIELTDDDRLISIPEKGKKGKVYINGALATSGDYLFTYNFDFEQMKRLGLGHEVEVLKNGQNRDREAVSIEAVEQSVRAIIGHLTDTDLIRHYLSTWQEKGFSQRREYSLWRLTIEASVKKVWREVARELYPGKVCQSPRYGLVDLDLDEEDDAELDEDESSFGRVNESEVILTLKDKGWTPLPDKMPNCLGTLIASFFPSVSQALGQERQKPEDLVMLKIPRNKWTPEQKAIYEEGIAAVGQVLNVEKMPDFGMFERSYDGLDAAGLWYQARIWCKREVVDAGLKSRHGFERLCGVIAHEYTHKHGGIDRTRTFESALTAALGVAIAAQVRGGRTETFEQSTERTKLGKWSDDYSEVLTFDQIIDRFAGSEWRFSCQSAGTRVNAVSEWHYVGVETTKNKTRRSKQVFWFTGRLDNKNRTPMTMSVTFKSNREVYICSYQATHAIRYIGHAFAGGIETPTTFLEHDLAA